MTEILLRYQASQQQANTNAMIIFAFVASMLIAWHGIALLPHTWHKPARLFGWVYAIVALGYTVIYSTGG